MKNVENFFNVNPTLNREPFPILHTIKSRIKSESSLKDKLARKLIKGVEIDEHNLFKNVTDMCGVRVLHLHSEQFATIHEEIMKHVDHGEWILAEAPRAFTWDPEAEIFFEKLGIETEVRPTYYTSIHYLVRMNERNPISCEIQVRTLFEEIWGEIDHQLNYPQPTDSIACKEQLRVMSKLVNTGTRLADSIFKSLKDYNDKGHPHSA